MIDVYAKLQVVKLSDLCKLEYAKFIYKFENNSLPIFSDNYFTNLDSIHLYNTCQKKKNKYFFPRLSTNFGKNTLHFLGLQMWSKIPQEIKNLLYIGFEKKLKKHLLNAYEINILDDKISVFFLFGLSYFLPYFSCVASFFLINWILLTCLFLLLL